MKKLTLFVAALLTLGLSSASYAQQQTQTTPQTETIGAPQAFKYQAIARNANGEAIANQNVSFRISILEGSGSGTVVYQETQVATTNQFGLANLSIGSGAIVSGVFNTIQWGSNTYFVKIEFDPKGGSDYTFMGESQMLSVPYSLYAEHARTADNISSFPVKGALQGTNLQAPFDSPETGMLVYNTDSAGTVPYNVVPGYYYNAGTPTNPNWVSLNNNNDPSNNFHRALTTCVSNTAYGGLTQGQAGANCVGNPTTGTENSFFGYDAGNAVTTGAANTAVGYAALSANISNNYNTGLGFQALTSTTANYNCGVGYQALAQNTSGTYNTATGPEAMYYNISGGGNTGTGYEALEFNETGNYNTATGDGALYTSSAGSYNTATGYNALYTNNSTSNISTADGAYALTKNTSGSNTATGAYSLYTNTNANDNTADGEYALYTNTGGSNTGIGAYTLYDNTTGSNNTAMGVDAMYDNTIGLHNIAEGYQALEANTTGSDNVVVGYQSMFSGTNIGDGNVILGDSVMVANTTGNFNVGIGYTALLPNTTGNYNIGIGGGTLASNTTGSYNTGVGSISLDNNVTGINNTAVGGFALASSYNASSNTAVGYDALYLNCSAGTGGSYNTAVGDSALYNNSTATSNCAVGYKSLSTNTTGSDNTGLGYGSNVSSATLTNATAIGYNASVTASNTVQLGNGSTTGLYIGTGSLSAGTGTALQYTSTGQVVKASCSRRYKNDIKDLNINTEMIYKLRPVSFVYKSDSSRTPCIGLIAEEVAKTIPEMAIYARAKDVINGSTADTLIPDGVQYSALSVLLLKEIQKHERTIKEQQQVIDSLKRANNMQANSIKTLQNAQSQLAKSQSMASDTQVAEEKEIAELKKLVDSMVTAQASIK